MSVRRCQQKSRVNRIDIKLTANVNMMISDRDLEILITVFAIRVRALVNQAWTRSLTLNVTLVKRKIGLIKLGKIPHKSNLTLQGCPNRYC